MTQPPDWSYDPAHDHGLSPADRAKSLLREAGLLETATHAAWRIFVRTWFRVWHRLEVRGREHLPAEPPFVVVANHSSHLDALALSTLFPARLCDRVFPIAAGDTFFERPAVAFFAAWAMNALPLWRRHAGPHALATLRERLTADRVAYIVFPEGTRSRTGEMAPFKAGLGTLVAGSAVPVIPCYLDGAHRAWPPLTSFPRPRKVRLSIGAPMTFAHLPNEREGWQKVAADLEAAVRSLA